MLYTKKKKSWICRFDAVIEIEILESLWPLIGWKFLKVRSSAISVGLWNFYVMHVERKRREFLKLYSLKIIEPRISSTLVLPPFRSNRITRISRVLNTIMRREFLILVNHRLIVQSSPRELNKFFVFSTRNKKKNK